MTYTVAELLGDPELATISLTPGVGEQREITWAHVCELADPWNWLGDGAQVMTTGLGIPEGEDQQVDYVERWHAAGIAAVSIGEKMSAPPLSQGMLARAHELGFPVLETALHKPFVVLAQAVSYANRPRPHGPRRARSGCGAGCRRRDSPGARGRRCDRPRLGG